MTLYRWKERARRAVDDNYYAVVIALIVLVTFAIGLTYATYAAVPPEDRIESSGDFQYSATVDEETPVFDAGTELENEQFYFPNASPQLDGEFTYSHEVDGNADLTVETQILAVTEEIDEEEEVTVWQETELLTSEEAEVGSGETHEVPFTVDLADEYDQVEQIETQFGNEWDPQLSIVAETQVSGTVNGQSVEMTERHELPMDIGELRYQVKEDRTPQAGAQGPLLSPVGLIMVMRGVGVTLIMVSLVGLVGLVAARQQGKLSSPDRDPTVMQFEQHRQLYDEWISTGVLPDDYLDTSRIQVPTLEELVNVAYDSDSRVINDLERNAYYVITGNAVYEFVPPNRGPDAEKLPPLEGDDERPPDDDFDQLDRGE